MKFLEPPPGFDFRLCSNWPICEESFHFFVFRLPHLLNKDSAHLKGLLWGLELLTCLKLPGEGLVPGQCYPYGNFYRNYFWEMVLLLFHLYLLLMFDKFMLVFGIYFLIFKVRLLWHIKLCHSKIHKYAYRCIYILFNSSNVLHNMLTYVITNLIS